ncbi:MAG: YceI family protein [Hyphomonadaceae bacterium]
MRLLALLLPLTLSACALTAEQTPQSLRALPTGAYKMEKPHASLLARVKHMGLSNYTVRLTAFDATLDFDPAKPAASKVHVIINPLSVQADHPTDAGWDTKIGTDFFKGAQFPQIVFDSTSAAATGQFTGTLTGNLTFRGITKPVTLDVTYNGGMDSAVMYGGRAAVGFSAHGTFKRSDFGFSDYLSAVSDDVEIVIEAEFTKH